MRSLADRFWGKVAKGAPSECWLWTGYRNKKGYGKFGLKGGPALAHRFSYAMHIGIIDDALCVLHKCDTPACVNPSHLFLGTRADNAADMVRKGRQPHVRGEACGRAVLSEGDVRAIRADTRIHRQIAADYGVRKHTISRIKSGVRWAHLA